MLPMSFHISLKKIIFELILDFQNYVERIVLNLKKNFFDQRNGYIVNQLQT